MKRILLATLLLASGAALAADNATLITPCASSCVTMRARDVGSGVQSMIQILGDTSGNPIYGTAGTANANILTVQGIASMTPLLATVTNGGTFATQATQAGTWTVQPGNTANTTAWLVTGTGGTFPAVLAAETTKVIGTVNVAAAQTIAVTNAGTFATQATQAGTWTVTGAGGTFPAVLGAETTKVIGTVRNLGNAGAIVDAATGAAVPANAWYIGMAQGGNLTGLTGTSGNLNVQCANCSGSGVSTADEATFTAGTSLFAGTGGFFQTTATNNALTNGQQGMWQMTANRAGFVNLRNAAGTELALNAGAASAATPRTVTASDSPEVAALGAIGDTAWVSGNGTHTSILKSIANGVTGAIAAGTNSIGKVVMQAITGPTTGGVTTDVIQCDSKAIYDASTNGSTELVALSSGKSIYICGKTFFSAGTANVKLIYGTGTACATGSTNLTPAYQLIAQTGLVEAVSFFRGSKTAVSNALCINTSAGVAVQAEVYYTQF